LISLPTLIQLPACAPDPLALSDWMRREASHLDDVLAASGAILIRGSSVAAVKDFEAICRILTPELLSYVGGGSPRTRLGGKVYTSTEYAASAHVPLHIEGAYLSRLPLRVWFCCTVPPSDGGQTPLGDMRRVRSRLPDNLVERFCEKGVLYVTNLHSGRGFGKSWQQTYQTENRAEVDAILVAHDQKHEWMKDGGLRVFARGPAFRPYSRTGEAIWVNQAVNWHPAHLGGETWKGLLKLFGDPVAFPKMAFYGDGTSIDPEDIATIAAALLAEEQVFEWQKGDILLIDNEVIAHGRQPFSGPRSIMVALA
jgi:hypothetical protein